MAAPWHWRPKEAPTAGLLYEPGNWGDLLKCSWLIEVMAALLDGVGPQALHYVDPFAGGPEYPLTPGARRRLALVGDGPLADCIAPFAGAGCWPSAATLAAARGLPRGRLEVYDADPGRRAALAASGRFTLLPVAGAWEVLERPPAHETTLLFIDPYDFVGEWRRRLGALLAWAGRAEILVYIYNRAARGPHHLQEYHAFRGALDDGTSGRTPLLGRVPADGFLPSAHHEMVLIPGPALAAGWDALAGRLADATGRIAGAVERSGIVEG